MTVQNTIRLNDKMTPVLRSIMKALNATLTAMSEMDKVSTRSLNAATRAARQASQAIDTMGSVAQRSTNKATTGQNKYTHSIRQSKDALSDLVEKAKALAVTYGLFQGGSKLVQAGDAYIGSKAQLELMLKMNNSQKTAAELQDQIYAASQRSLGNYREMSKSVGKLGMLAKDAFGGNTDEMIAFTELLNKQFSLVKATPWEKSAAMYQLTQAMASGRLQGDEFRSIIENAPMLAQTIQEYMGLTGQAFKDASKNGEITADVIKNALFSVAEETNRMFAELPINFGELWTQITNKIDKGLEPVYDKLGKLWNDKQFQQFLNVVVNGLVNLANMAVYAMKIFSGIGNTIMKYWEFIAPIILGVTAAYSYFFATQAIGWAKNIGLMLWKIAVDWMETGAILAMYAAQNGLNVALAMCPLSWIVYGIIALIAVVYIVIAAINKWAGTTISATGVIVGVITTAVAAIWNTLLALGEFIWGLIKLVLNNFVMLANFTANVFKNPVSSIIYLFRDLGNQILTIIGTIASAIDAVFGTKLSQGVDNWKNSLNTMAGKAVDKFAKDENYEEKFSKFDKSLQDMGVGRINYGTAWDTGYKWGKNKMDEVKDSFTIGDKQYDMENFAVKSVPMSELNNKNLDGINKNTGDTANALKQGVNLSDEDVQLLKDYARVQFTTHLTSLTPKVNAKFGDVRESADVTVIMKLLEKFVKDASESNLTT